MGSLSTIRCCCRADRGCIGPFPCCSQTLGKMVDQARYCGIVSSVKLFNSAYSIFTHVCCLRPSNSTAFVYSFKHPSIHLQTLNPIKWSIHLQMTASYHHVQSHSRIQTGVVSQFPYGTVNIKSERNRGRENRTDTDAQRQTQTGHLWTHSELTLSPVRGRPWQKGRSNRRCPSEPDF